MPEGMNLEVAHKLSEREEREAREKRRWQELVEIVEVVILAVVAVATAWSGYQAARWDGRQAFLYGTSSRLRLEAEAAETIGAEQRLQDVTTFNTWIQAHQDGDELLPTCTSTGSVPITASRSTRGCRRGHSRTRTRPPDRSSCPSTATASSNMPTR